MHNLSRLAILSALISVTTVSFGASRIDRIKETKTLQIGAPESALPFSYLDANQKPVGYTVEVCQAAAGLIAKKLGIDDLRVNYVPTTSSTRLVLIQNGTIDLECGNTTNKADRKKQVDFSPTTFIAQVVLVAKKSSGVNVNDLSTFRGKTIAATSGGQTYKVAADLNAEHHYGITMAGAPDTTRAFIMMATDRADAAVSDDALLYAAVAKTKNPKDYVVGTHGLDFAPYGIVEPKGDPEFKALVDEAVIQLMKNGEIARLYQKYFDSPITARKINLNYPMSDILKNAIANPTDSSDPADYKH
ncbi:amino acid ABC transporter substrate-binding protein [Candidimonas nitroreducens]|uniref:Amino acid ABC transporter substrate-binding protein n=1 Tax=Candidimonas nitroreducens TaxID=683354 RepID=A0A225N0T4_9BURK|nr:amino acid ABC transporter substrate-binding protein [Candidimonas nitroreducens]OWT65670.1 amino acid ABC transporter substrate-binding protein [Candidimonas nitroreducens]